MLILLLPCCYGLLWLAFAHRSKRLLKNLPQSELRCRRGSETCGQHAAAFLGRERPPAVSDLFRQAPTHDWRWAAVSSAVTMGVLLVIITEVLGAFSGISRWSVAVAWALLGAGLLASAPLCSRWLYTALNDIKTFRCTLSAFDARTVSVCFIIAAVCITALLSPPNVKDAMSYHMPRVVEWAERGSVSFYPTPDYQQLTMPPWTEYAMLHAYVLFGNDRFVNLVPFFCFLGCLLVVALIAEELGGNRRIQGIAVLICATIPQGILTASGAKNDSALSFWLAATVYFLLRMRHDSSWTNTLNAAASMALALFTKGTAYLFLPFLFVPCWLMFSRSGRRQMLLRVPVILAVILSLNAILWVRNFKLSGSPLGFSSPDGEQDVNGNRRFAIQRFTTPGVLTSTILNASLHLGTPFDVVNRIIYSTCVKAIHVIGEDPNDPALTAAGKSGILYPFAINPMTWRHEVRAGNLLHFVLIVIVTTIVILKIRTIPRTLLLLSVALIFAFTVFGVVIRYQPFNSRFHLPMFVLAASLAACVIGMFGRPGFIKALEAVLILDALPYALGNSLRPLMTTSGLAHSVFRMSRAQLYFFDQDNQDLVPTYLPALAAARSLSCHDVGIDTSLHRADYQLFALLSPHLGDDMVRYVGVNNRSQAYAKAADYVRPCAVICTGCASSAAKKLSYQRYLPNVRQFGDLLLFAAGPVNTVNELGPR